MQLVTFDRHTYRWTQCIVMLELLQAKRIPKLGAHSLSLTTILQLLGIFQIYSP